MNTSKPLQRPLPTLGPLEQCRRCGGEGSVFYERKKAPAGTFVMLCPGCRGSGMRSYVVRKGGN